MACHWEIHMKRPFESLCVSALMVFALLWGSVVGVFAQDSDRKLAVAMEEAQTAGIPPATVNSLMILGYEKQFQPSAMADLLRLLAQAQNEGIPLQPMISKIEEGIIKRAKPSAIEQVITKKIDNYRLTRSLVGGYLKKRGQKSDSIPDEYLVRLTESLYCGLSQNDLERVFEEAPAASLPALTRGVDILASLKQMRFDSDLAEQVVLSGIRHNYFTPRPNDFVRVIAVAKKKGVSDRKIASAALDVIELKGSVEDLSERVGVSAQELSRYGPQYSVNIYGGSDPKENEDGPKRAKWKTIFGWGASSDQTGGNRNDDSGMGSAR